MIETEKEQMRQWLDNWKEAGKRLEELRIKEIRESDPEMLSDFESAFWSALFLTPNSPTSGMVEMQRKFAKLRK
jgi:hypothetical protein